MFDKPTDNNDLFVKKLLDDHSSICNTPREGSISNIIDEFGCSALEIQQTKSSNGDLSTLIRLQNDLDQSLRDIKSKNDIQLMIDTVKTKQSEYGYSDLYKREWYSQKRNGYNPNTMFTVAQFNTLAEGLSSGPDVKRPFCNGNKDIKHRNNNKKDRCIYGGFSNIPHPNIVLDFNLRKWRLLEVILGDSVCSAPYDIIALEEVDRHYGFFAPIMNVFGYDGFFVPKRMGPSTRLGWYSDGCSLFWKRDVFEVISKERGDFKIGNQCYMLVLLRHKPSQIPILVAVTHLKAQQSTANENVRCNQVHELLLRLDEERKKHTTNDYVGDNIPILLLGDFNADPPSYFDNPCTSAIHQILNHSKFNYQSAYTIVQHSSNNDDNDDFYTTWKIRGDVEKKRIIDYIFYDDDGSNNIIQCTDTLKIPSIDELDETKLPSLRYPSDHVLLAAKFYLKNSL